MLLTLAIGLLLTLGLSSLSGWQAYSAPIDCSDGYGHSPDPGTKECENAIEWKKASRSQIILAAFLAPVPWCVAALTFVLLVQGLSAFLRSRGMEF
jgi:hypothetical protein